MKKRKKTKKEQIVLIGFQTIPIRLVFVPYKPIFIAKNEKELLEILYSIDPQKNKKVSIIPYPDVSTFLTSKIYKILEKNFTKNEDLKKELEQVKISLINTEKQFFN